MSGEEKLGAALPGRDRQSRGHHFADFPYRRSGELYVQNKWQNQKRGCGYQGQQTAWGMYTGVEGHWDEQGGQGLGWGMERERVAAVWWHHAAGLLLGALITTQVLRLFFLQTNEYA